MRILQKIRTLLLIVLGAALKAISKPIPANESLWVFGSGNGALFVDNSKHFYEYVLRVHPDVTPVWISRNSSVVGQIRRQGGIAYHNFSPRGILTVLRARCYVMSTNISDVLFFYKRKGRIIINLWHGMPIKKIVYDHPRANQQTLLVSRLWQLLVVGFSFQDVDLIASTSPFFQRFMQSAFRNPNVEVTGLPRNDYFFGNSELELKKRLGIEGKTVVTYMPTHRKYGKGAVNPIIFQSDPVAQDFLKRNNIVVLCKLHVNMLHKHVVKEAQSSVLDISNLQVDPQELMLISDILITDYSSCVIDYLLLNRPVILYHYDNYEGEDNPVYFNLEEFFSDDIATDEETLLKKISERACTKRPRGVSHQRITVLSHELQDGKSAERIFLRVKEMIGDCPVPSGDPRV